MKERPILFSAPMVRAILEGRKTQTRRVVKYRVVPRSDSGMLDFWRIAVDRATQWAGSLLKGKGNALKLCPYGAPGDRLWVRETWSKAKSCNASDLFYRADGDRQYGRQHALSYVEREDRWRPSIHMPRWASRITLEITGVRVERLQEISQQDAKAEGVKVREIIYPDEPRTDYDYRYQYSFLWDDINGSGAWAANPWVWVISFARVPE